MKKQDCKLNVRYKSINLIAKGCTYEVLKKNKTTCDVKLWEDGVETDISNL